MLPGDRPAEERTTTTYDVHAHCVPDELIRLLGSEGDRLGIEIVDGEKGAFAVIADRVHLPPFRPVLSDLEARLAAMDKAGIDIQLISSWVDLTAYALPGEQGAEYSRRFNEILAAEASKHPGRLLALGTVPLQSPRHAAEELRHAVEVLGMAGAQIASTVDQTDLDQAGLDPFWEAAEALRCLILIHPCNPLAGVDLSRNFLDNMVGRPAESSIALAHLLFSGVLERYPELIVCSVHGGGFLPYQLGRMQHGYETVPHLTAKNMSIGPTELARRLYYDTILHDSQALAFLVERIGADRVVMGSDYPFEMGDHDPIASVDRVPGLSGQQRDLILGGNVSGILDRVRR